jgi:hypothetical protein
MGGINAAHYYIMKFLNAFGAQEGRQKSACVVGLAGLSPASL